jgi:hypothetical protein
MSARTFEVFLTRLYVDAEARARFRANPRAEAQHAGLSEAECRAIEEIDWVELEMASHSFAGKRDLKRRRDLRNSFKSFLSHLLAAGWKRFRRS